MSRDLQPVAAVRLDGDGGGVGGAAVRVDGVLGGFRLDEWAMLPQVCLIGGCSDRHIDRRGPIWLRDGSMHKACVRHWESIMTVLGEQAERERGRR